MRKGFTRLLSSGAPIALALTCAPVAAQVTPAPPPADDPLQTTAPKTEPAEGRATESAAPNGQGDPASGVPAPTDADDAALSGEVIVTAQRRAERVQDIPIALSAFGAAQIQRTGIVSLENVAPRVPSFYFGSFGPSRPQLYIRGIGTRSFDPGSESSVGVFVDEVYLGRATGSFGSLKDIERIEVLRGPQGTLYGRNTIGGAINVISKGPTPTFKAEVEAGLSNYDGYELFGAVGGPITSDATIMFRVAAWRTYRDGYMTNLTTGTKFQGVDNWGGRARLTFKPSDNFRVDISAELVRDDDESAFAGFNRGSGPSQNPTTGVITPANPLATFLGNPALPPIRNPGGRSGFLSVDPLLYRKAQTYISRIEYDASFATLTSITSGRLLKSDEFRDLEGSSRRILDQRAIEDSKQLTQELRLTSNPDGPASFDGKFDWIIGGFYYRDRSDRSDAFIFGPDSVVASIPLGPGLPGGGPQTSVSAANFEIDSYAAFAQGTLHLGALDLTVGGRYTRDEKRAIQVGTNTRPGIPLVAVPFRVDNSATYTSFDPRFVATYNFSQDVNVYASYSTGFKSGGFQFVPFSAAQANVLFEPEDIKTYEVGLKSEWLDRRLQLNVAAFKYDYKDLQVSRIVDLGGGAAASLIDNAATSDVKGVDVELVMRPTRNFDVSVAYGYLDAKYGTYTTNAPGTPLLASQNYSGTALVRAPDHTINVGAEWRVPLSEDSRLTLRGDLSLLDTFYGEPGEGRPIFGGAASLSEEPSYALLDLRAAFEWRRFRLTAYANNVFNKQYRRTVFALGSTASDYPGQPRVYGFKLGYSF